MAVFPAWTRHLALVLALALALLGGQGTPARANTVTDKLNECLNIVGAAAATVQAGLDGASEIAKAMADPTNAACVSEASSGNPLTIAFMGAMTGVFIAATADGNEPFHDVAGCNDAIKQTLAGLIAGLLKDIINADFIGDILKSILPDAAVDLIMKVANNVADGASTELADAMIQALGPVGHYLQCGCAAAGIAAITYDTAKDVAKKAEAVGDSAAACGDLGSMLWDDPAAFAEALLGNPGAVVDAVVNAVCHSAGDVSEGVCDAAKAIWRGAAYLCEKSGVCAAAEAFWDGVSDIGHELYCGLPFTDCSEPPPPTPPPACEAGFVDRSMLTGGATCTCQQPNGWAFAKEVRVSSLYGTQETYDVKVCRTCAANEGNQNGWCVKCPPGFNQDPATGQCSKPLICPSGSIIKPDNSGCYACPAGSVFAADGSGCTPDCSAQPWTKLEKGYSLAPTGYYSGGWGSVPPWAGGVCACPKGQYNNGTGCSTTLVCPAWQRPDEKTGTCVDYCSNTNQRYVDTSPPSCVPCGEGKTAIGDTCVAVCGEGSIRSGDSCMTCPAGTQADSGGNAAGESLSCSPICRPGSTYNAPSPVPTDIDTGNLSLPTGFSLDNSNAGAAGAAASGAHGSAKGLQGAAAGAAAAAAGAAANKGAGVAAAAGKLGAQANNAGVKSGGAGRNNAGSPKNDACQPCAANERYVTSVSMTGSGGSVTQGACMACPSGMIASYDGKSCVHSITGFFTHRRAATREVPAVRASTGTTETPRITPRATPEQPPRERPRTVERPAPRPALRCPPGRSPNASGTGCVVDLDDSGPAPGRSNAPSGGGGASTYRR